MATVSYLADFCKPYLVHTSCGHLVVRKMRESTAGVTWTETTVLEAPNGAPCDVCAAEQNAQFEAQSAAARETVKPVDERHHRNVTEICKIIAAALKRRSGRSWSVTHGRGTAYGWITISSQPKARVHGSMSEKDAIELAALLGLDHAHHQGVDVPASSDYRREYIERAETGTATTFGKPYWD